MITFLINKYVYSVKSGFAGYTALSRLRLNIGRGSGTVKTENFAAARLRSWSLEDLEHGSADIVGGQSPEQVPLPESEDAFGIASSTMAENDDPAEDGQIAPKELRSHRSR